MHTKPKHLSALAALIILTSGAGLIQDAIAPQLSPADAVEMSTILLILGVAFLVGVILLVAAIVNPAKRKTIAKKHTNI